MRFADRYEVKSRVAAVATPVILATSAVVLLVLALFLINREDASSVANAAETAMVADNTLSVVTAIRTASSYAVAFEDVGQDVKLGLVEDISEATVELESRMERLVGIVGGQEGATLEASATHFLRATSDVVSAISNDIEGLSPRLEIQGETMATLVDDLLQVRDANVEQVLVAGEDVGRAANVVRFLVVFAIPLAVMVSLWRIQRRLSERRVMRAEVEKQRQLASSKDAFVADVSHELRTPLTGIYGFALALEEQSTNLNDFQAELLSLIISESAELTRMVDDLIAIGRIDAGAVSYSMETVDVAEAIEQVVKPFQRLGINFEHDSEGLTVYADPARFRQIVRNLLSNAVRYGSGEVAVAAYGNGSETTIEVIDDGPGVPDDVAERMFERYVHAEGSGIVEGSVGLGLAIARSFAVGMGGELRYLREADLTIFQLSLPNASVSHSSERAVEVPA